MGDPGFSLRGYRSDKPDSSLVKSPRSLKAATTQFSMIIQKQYARRDITGYKSPYDDPFVYRPINEIGMDEVCRLMIPFVENKSNPDILSQSRIEFDELIQFAGNAYQPEYWYVASDSMK